MKILITLLLLALPLHLFAAGYDPYTEFAPRPTYEAYTGVIPAANATDICAIIGTSSSKKITRVQKVRVTSSQTTAGTVGWYLVKRSTADTGGTQTAMTMVPYDSRFVAATSSVTSWTANPTLGTSLGIIQAASVGSYATGTANGPSTYEFNFIASGGGPGSIVLKNATEELALNFQGAALPAGFSAACDFIWTEDQNL